MMRWLFVINRMMPALTSVLMPKRRLAEQVGISFGFAAVSAALADGESAANGDKSVAILGAKSERSWSVS
jgi:hypothetical protein